MNSTPIKAVVFDVGGVLLRTEDRSHREALEEKYHLPPHGTDALVFDSPAAKSATLGTATPDTIWGHIAQALQLSPEELHQFQVAFWRGDRLDEDLLDFLQGLRTEYTTALLSNAWSNLRTILARDYDILEGKTVDHILISAEIGYAKPDPRIYHHLSEKLSIDYASILFVDDFIENVEAARKLGICSIHFAPEKDMIQVIQENL